MYHKTRTQCYIRPLQCGVEESIVLIAFLKRTPSAEEIAAQKNVILLSAEMLVAGVGK
jgi:hypothetical protein